MKYFIFSILLGGAFAFAGIPAGNIYRQPKAPTVQFYNIPGVSSYTPPSGVLYIKIHAWGGGAGGTGSGTVGGANGGAGGSTFLGTAGAVFNCNGGNVGSFGSTGGTGGSCTNTLGTVVYNFNGGDGMAGGATTAAGTRAPGGSGGDAPIFSSGGKKFDYTGSAGANTPGGGGQGGGNNAVAGVVSGSGGGSGGYIELIVPKAQLPTAPITLTIGAAGTAGAAGTSGLGGSVGAIGYMIIEEFYQ